MSVLYINNSQIGDIAKIITINLPAFCYSRYDIRSLSQFPGTLPPFRIGDGVAEHVEECGLNQGIELGEGLAALDPQGIRRI